MQSWTFIVWLCFSWLAVKGDLAASKLGRSDRDRDLAPLDVKANALNIFNGAGSSKKGRTTKPTRPSSSKGKRPVPTPQPTPAPTPQPTPAPTPPPFSGILTLQAQEGVCSGTGGEYGCTGFNGESGNPNDLLNCYDVTSIGGTAPFVIDRVRFWIGSMVALPDDLSVIVYSSASGAPSTLIGSEALTGFVMGVNTILLTTPITVNTPQFCIGVNSQDINAALRLQVELFKEGPSFGLLPNCNIASFTALGDKIFCIEAFVRAP